MHTIFFFFMLKALCQFDLIVYTNSVINGELLFLLLGTDIEVSEVTHTVVTCLHDSPPKKTAGYEGLGDLPWLVVLCMCCHASLLGKLNASM